MLRNDAGLAGQPLSLTKPLGIGVLNSRHKATGEVFPNAVDAMTTLNRLRPRRRLSRAGCRCATDVTGFGLLGHALKLARASRVTAVIDSAAVPYPRRAPGRRRPPGTSAAGTRRISTGSARTRSSDISTSWKRCCWLTPRPRVACWSPARSPGAPVIGELVPLTDELLIVR
jgi:selenide,water dikinase